MFGLPGGPVVKGLPASAGKWSESHSLMSDSLRLQYSPWSSPGQNTGLGSLSLLQGIFPTQGLNPGLPHCRRILYQLSHKGRLPVQRTGFKPWSKKIPHAVRQLSLWATTTEPVLQRSCCATGGATTGETPLAATRESPHSNEDPAQPKVNKIIF